MSETRAEGPTILTLDAGGTKFSFAALRGGQRVTEPIVLPAEADSLERSLANLYEGFSRVAEAAGAAPEAISFAFPGPADYQQGIIYNVGNLPAYAGGVPLAAMLRERFGIPVFINNDGDLFALGEAHSGLLPAVNARLEASGSERRYRNLIGLTLGTGLGGGIVLDGRLLAGDNSQASEVWLLRHSFRSDLNIEEGVSIRAVVGGYASHADDPDATQRLPHDIARIASGQLAGDAQAARRSFAEFGRALGDAIANLIAMFDGLVVLGGGLIGASAHFLPAVMEVVNGTFSDAPGSPRRLTQRVHNLACDEDAAAFFAPPASQTNDTPSFNPRTAIGLSSLGTSEAVGIGAYAAAIAALAQPRAAGIASSQEERAASGTVAR